MGQFSFSFRELSPSLLVSLLGCTPVARPRINRRREFYSLPSDGGYPAGVDPPIHDEGDGGKD
jgi:hypothetical protein